MIHKIFFAVLLLTILLNIPSYTLIDYAFAKDKPDKDNELKSSKDDTRERDYDKDKDKIFDDLEEELKGRSEDRRTGIVALLNVPAEQVKEKVRKIKGDVGEFEVGDTYSVISGFSAKLSKKQVLALAGLDTTVQIERDSEVHAFLNTATSWFGVQKARTDFIVDGSKDGNPSTYSKNDIVIAVIDTGIYRYHKDLNSGKVIGWKDFVNYKTTPYDDNGHGTHVASIAAGEGEANSANTGVAPKAALVGVKVLDSTGSGTISKVMSGINWAVKNKATYGIEIINLSLGTNGCSNGKDSLSLMVNRAFSSGIVPVVAGGNEGPQYCTTGSPAAAENAITVGAMADVGERGFYLASFSSRGPTLDNRIKPDVLAPGVSIMAAKRATASGYTTMSGTSMASAFVAGLAALMLDANPSLTPGGLKSMIKSTAVDWGPIGADTDYGSGRLDGYEAMRNAFSVPPPGNNIAVPTHSFISDRLEALVAPDNWIINVVNPNYPVAIALIMPTWTANFPDFDIKLFNPSGSMIGISDGITRQETISVLISEPGAYTLQVYSFEGSGAYFLDVSSGS